MPLNVQRNEASEAARSRLANLLRFLEQDPDNLNLLADVADQALAVGDIDVAAGAVRHALALRPAAPPFVLRQSSVAIADKKFDEALALTTYLIEQGVLESAVRFNHALALSSAGRFAESRKVLEGLQGETLANPERMVVMLLIRACHYLGDLDYAIKVALEYLELCPEDALVAGMLSLLYFDRDDLPHAARWSQKSLTGGSIDNVDALLAAGGAALAQEDSDTARDLMNRAIQLEPGCGRAWTNLGMADLLMGELTSSCQQFMKAVTCMPGHTGTWVALGWVQVLLGDTNAAEHSFRSALAIDENFGETHGGLAAVAAARGDWQEAEKLAKIARRLNPESVAPLYPQVLRLYREGKADAAQNLIESALKRGNAPAGGSLFDMLGRLQKSR